MQKLPRGELPPGHKGGGRALPPLGAPPASWAHGGPPPLIPAPHTSSSFQKNHQPAQARVLAHLAAIFDLLAQSSIHKTTFGGLFFGM